MGTQAPGTGQALQTLQVAQRARRVERAAQQVGQVRGRQAAPGEPVEGAPRCGHVVFGLPALQVVRRRACQRQPLKALRGGVARCDGLLQRKARGECGKALVEGPQQPQIGLCLERLAGQQQGLAAGRLVRASCQAQAGAAGEGAGNRAA